MESLGLRGDFVFLLIGAKNKNLAWNRLYGSWNKGGHVVCRETGEDPGYEAKGVENKNNPYGQSIVEKSCFGGGHMRIRIRNEGEISVVVRMS